MTSRVGIFAGTFDPIHNGHIACCLDAKQQFGLDTVTLMIEPEPWRKIDVTSYDMRYEMGLIATQSYPDIILEYTKERRFSVASTLPELLGKNEGVDLYLIMGADEFAHLPQWEGVKEIVSAAGFIVGLRDKHTHEHIKKTLDQLTELSGMVPRHHTFQSAYPGVSSSKVKRELTLRGHSDNLDPLVEAYIKDNRLYSVSASA